MPWWVAVVLQVVAEAVRLVLEWIRDRSPAPVRARKSGVCDDLADALAKLEAAKAKSIEESRS